MADGTWEWHHWAFDDPVVTQLNILRQLDDLQGRVGLSSAVANKTFQAVYFRHNDSPRSDARFCHDHQRAVSRTGGIAVLIIASIL